LSGAVEALARGMAGVGFMASMGSSALDRSKHLMGWVAWA